jgi:hypothetical protein
MTQIFATNHHQNFAKLYSFIQIEGNIHLNQGLFDCIRVYLSKWGKLLHQVSLFRKLLNLSWSSLLIRQL